jgi:hypothetical protein
MVTNHKIDSSKKKIVCHCCSTFLFKARKIKRAKAGALGRFKTQQAMTHDRWMDEILVVKRVHDQPLLFSTGARSGFKPIRQLSTSNHQPAK